MPLSQGQSIQINNDKMLMTSDRKGSRPGGFCKDKAENEYYLKYASLNPENKHKLQNEILAFKLYQLLGVHVPNASLVQFEHEGENYLGILTEKVNIKTVKELHLQKNHDFKIDLIEDFLIDVFLANWDVAGRDYSNLCVYLDNVKNTPFRLDLDAVLLYNNGVRKNLNEQAVEFENLLNPNFVNEETRLMFTTTWISIYKHMRLGVGLQKLLSISDEQIAECVRENGFDSQQENDELINLLKKRRAILIAKAEEKFFNHSIIAPCLLARAKKDDKINAVHAVRVALHTEQFISLLQNCEYQSTRLHLTEKDQFLIKIAAFFRESGEESIQSCDQILDAIGFSNGEISKVIQAINHKHDPMVQGTNFYALILDAADILDLVRTYSGPFNVKDLPMIIQNLIPENLLLDLAEKAKIMAVEQGDASLAQFGNFNRAEKKKYENIDNCYTATKNLYREVFNRNSQGSSSQASIVDSGKGKDVVVETTAPNVESKVTTKTPENKPVQPISEPKVTTEDLSNLKTQIHDKMHQYISRWKCSFFGHHHNRRAWAILLAIEEPKTNFNQICDIIDNQLELFEKGSNDQGRTHKINAELLESRWSDELRNSKQDISTSGYYRKLRSIKDELLAPHEKAESQEHHSSSQL